MQIGGGVLTEHPRGLCVNLVKMDEYTPTGQDTLLLNKSFGPEYIEKVCSKYYSETDGVAQIDYNRITFDGVRLIMGDTYQMVIADSGNQLTIFRPDGAQIFPSSTLPIGVDCREIVAASFIFGLLASDNHVKKYIRKLLNSRFQSSIGDIPDLNGETEEF